MSYKNDKYITWISRGDNTMDKERSDKGTVRELTELAEKVTEINSGVLRVIRNGRIAIEDGDDLRKEFDKIESEVEARLTKLREMITSYDQRDRLEKDKAE